MENLLILVLALIWDVLLGEPPRWAHPVAGLGKIISLQMRLASFQSSPAKQFLYGMLIVIFTLSLFTFVCYLVLSYLRELNVLVYILIGAYLLKSTFSLKELHRAALRVKKDLERDYLAKARVHIKDLVGRDTTSLEKPRLVSAAVESVAENTSDSFVAPLFFFLILGIPGAWAYRVTNTYDSMIGYRGKNEYLGKFAARTDDVLSFLPSRITGFLTVVAAFCSRRCARKSLQVMLRDHGRTKSPNAGWPMSAAAGALQVQLVKVGHYSLGDERNELNTALISSGVKLMLLAALAWTILVFLILLTGHFKLSF